jgi:hypothetical protein
VATLERARDAKTMLRDEIAGTDGVTGVGLTRSAAQPARQHADAVRQGGDDWVLRVNVTSRDVVVPQSVDGVDVEVRVVGAVTPSAPTA